MTKKIYFIAEVPSNIAFIKYWGKRDDSLQWPANDSLSMTLDRAKSITRVAISENNQDEIKINDRIIQPSLASFTKIFAHLDYLRRTFDFKEKVQVSSVNTFPMASGIASSASGFGSLSLGLLAAWTKSSSFGELEKNGFSRQKISSLARLGSGSACRSFWGGFVHWHTGQDPASQEVVQIFPESHWPLSDLIIIFSELPKEISSSQGHKTAWTSPKFAQRLREIPAKLEKMILSLQRRSLLELGGFLEEEALEMVEIMSSSTPPLNYLTDKTREFLAWVINQRKSGNFPAYFTLDAGPNVHLICEKKDLVIIKQQFLNSPFRTGLLVDEVGKGPDLKVQNE